MVGRQHFTFITQRRQRPSTVFHSEFELLIAVPVQKVRDVG